MARRPPSKRDRIQAILTAIPDDVGKLPDGPIDAEEIGALARGSDFDLAGRGTERD